jgi:hypothetical protein
MNPAAPLELDLTTGQAVSLVRSELADARRAVKQQTLDPALDHYTRSLGLALQLGPATCELVLGEIVQAARTLAQERQAEGLGALGPAVSGVIQQVLDAGALPETPIMAAWATVAIDLGALVGQLGLALLLPADRRSGMMEQVRNRADALDEATGTMFGLGAWLDEIN